MDNKGIRKLRKNSMTQRLIDTLGIEEVENIWKEYGMYKGSEVLSRQMQEYVSPYTLRYMSQIYDWKRELNNLCPLYKGVLAGSVPAAYYKHLIFPDEVNSYANSNT